MRTVVKLEHESPGMKIKNELQPPPELVGFLHSIRNIKGKDTFGDTMSLKLQKGVDKQTSPDLLVKYLTCELSILPFDTTVQLHQKIFV